MTVGCMSFMNKHANPYYFGQHILDNTKYKKVKSVGIYDYTENNAKYFLDRGYIIKAKTAFRNTLVHMSWAELAAKQMGASVMLYQNDYVGTSSGTTAIPWYIPGETYVVNSQTNSNINLNSYGNSMVVGSNGYGVGSSSSSLNGTYNSNTTTTLQTPGKYVMREMAYSYNYYDQYALFMVKKYYWINQKVSFLEKPKKDSKLFSEINSGEWFILLNKGSKFNKIQYNGTVGYVDANNELN